MRATLSALGLRSTASDRKFAAAATCPPSLSFKTASVMKPMSSESTSRARSYTRAASLPRSCWSIRSAIARYSPIASWTWPLSW